VAAWERQSGLQEPRPAHLATGPAGAKQPRGPAGGGSREAHAGAGRCAGEEGPAGVLGVELPKEAQPGKLSRPSQGRRGSGPAGAEGPAGILAWPGDERKGLAGAGRGGEESAQAGQAGRRRPSRDKTSRPDRDFTLMPAQPRIFRPGLLICRPGKLYAGQDTYNPAQLLFTRLLISCTHNTTYTLYISHK
jgi:hypothetical protein